ncbi:hypothetical protein [Volucribacter amazonae]|uniref:Uncharacterized protein n=1 Tax=Volucribacter amazonae TaxID=256731 RepID=A0A9X4SME7_9PAST|nr:hypothetical protein [Volucribacter amazonae]MDG6896023.1 hypothetical protein [Volucribacter amazonae]
MKYLLYSLLFIFIGYGYSHHNEHPTNNTLEQEKIINHITTGMDHQHIIALLGQPSNTSDYSNHTQCLIYSLTNQQYFYLLLSHDVLLLYSDQQNCTQLVDKMNSSHL